MRRHHLISNTNHDDVIKWKHFPRYWPFVRGIHRSPVNSSHKGQWRGALLFSLICVWINGWVNNREAGDFRRHRAHYDVTLMSIGEWGVLCAFAKCDATKTHIGSAPNVVTYPQTHKNEGKLAKSSVPIEAISVINSSEAFHKLWQHRDLLKNYGVSGGENL